MASVCQGCGRGALSAGMLLCRGCGEKVCTASCGNGVTGMCYACIPAPTRERRLMGAGG